MSRRQINRSRSKLAKDRMKKPVGEWKVIPMDDPRNPPPRWATRAYQNNRFTVIVNDNAKTSKGKAIKALVQRLDDRPIRNHWRSMQDIKNELFGEEKVAIEFYPKESELIDQHNIYWMWILPEEHLPMPIL